VYRRIFWLFFLCVSAPLREISPLLNRIDEEDGADSLYLLFTRVSPLRIIRGMRISSKFAIAAVPLADAVLTFNDSTRPPRRTLRLRHALFADNRINDSCARNRPPVIVRQEGRLHLQLPRFFFR
jgi:hypothetical protein